MSENKSKPSPIVAIAATSITLFSLVGIGVLAGIVPSSYSKDKGQQASVAAAADAPRDGAARKNTEPARLASAARPQRAPAATCASCGTVIAVNAIETKGEGSGLGAVAGGVVGGVLGNQVGGGSGRKIATVAGLAGGALAGHELEKRYKTERRYEVAVRMEDGTTRQFTYEHSPAYEPGDKVKVVEGRLTR